VSEWREELDDATVIRRFAGQPVDQDSIAHYRGLLQRRLLLNRCTKCGVWHHPPRPVCPACWSFDVRPAEPSGRGTIYLLTFLERGGGSPPHPIATVDLDEQAGLRYTATVDGLGEREAVRVGDRVELAWIERDGMAAPAFRPSGDHNGRLK
jgi:uncharacterized OB-fold protein